MWKTILRMRVVSNTSPIWNLASIQRLDLLHDQFSEILIPSEVLAELQLESGCPEPLDCNDSNPHIFPSNTNDFCDCAEPNPQGTTEICDDGIDNNCDGVVDCPGPCAASAEASTYPPSPVIGSSDLVKRLVWFLLPVGAVIVLKILRRKR